MQYPLTSFPILHILNAIHSDEGKEYPRGRCREGPDGARPSGGAGKVEDFTQLFQTLPGVDAGLAASVFHFGQIAIPDLKAELRKNGILVR